MPGCAAFGCSNRTGPFFKFPSEFRNGKRLKVWLHNVGRTDFPYKTARLCKKHFSEDQFENHRADGKRKLKPNAIPTLFSHRPDPQHRKPPTKRKRGQSPSKDSKKEDTDFSQNENLKYSNSVESIKQDHEYHVKTISDQIIGNTTVISDRLTTTENNDVLSNNCICKSCCEKDEKIHTLQKIIELQKKRIQKLKTSLNNVNNNLKTLLNEDQLKALQRQKNALGKFQWNDSTIQKAIQIRTACGLTGYNIIRNIGQPLPNERTLRRRWKESNLTLESFNDGNSSSKLK